MIGQRHGGFLFNGRLEEVHVPAALLAHRHILAVCTLVKFEIELGAMRFLRAISPVGKDAFRFGSLEHATSPVGFGGE
jgi:hypothetical protein